MFYVQVSIKDKRTKPKESIPLSLLLKFSKDNFFEGCFVFDITFSFGVSTVFVKNSSFFQIIPKSDNMLVTYWNHHPMVRKKGQHENCKLPLKMLLEFYILIIGGSSNIRRVRQVFELFFVIFTEVFLKNFVLDWVSYNPKILLDCTLRRTFGSFLWCCLLFLFYHTGNFSF